MKYLLVVAMTVAATSFATAGKVCTLKDVRAAQNQAIKIDLSKNGKNSGFANTMRSVENPKEIQTYEENGQTIVRGSAFYYTNKEYKIEEGFSVHLKLDGNCKLQAYELVEDVVCHR